MRPKLLQEFVCISELHSGQKMEFMSSLFFFRFAGAENVSTIPIVKFRKCLFNIYEEIFVLLSL